MPKLEYDVTVLGITALPHPWSTEGTVEVEYRLVTVDGPMVTGRDKRGAPIATALEPSDDEP